MKIGIDIRKCKSPLDGIGRYSIEIIFNLVNSGDTYYLYSPFPIEMYEKSYIDKIKESPNIIFRSSSCKGTLCTLFWSQTVLAYWAIKDKIDILWTPTIRLPLLLPRKIKKFITIHDMVFKYAPKTMKPYKHIINSIIMPLVLKLANVIISVSNSTTNDVIKNYPKYESKVKTISLGTKNFGEAKAFSTLKVLGITKPFFLVLGTIEPRKNLRRLLYAYASLSQNIRNETNLVITGNVGWGNQLIPELVDTLRLSNNVIITGYVEDMTMATLYKHAKFLAMVSIYEGFGLPIIEANYYGTPVLTSNISSMPEVAGKAGLLINPFEINSITIGLEKLLCDDKKLTELTGHARNNALRYNWQRTSTETLKVFKELFN